MDFLIWVHDYLQAPVSALGVRPLARGVYRRMLRARYGNGRLARARQNGRLWKLHPEVALRGEFQEFDTIEWMRNVVKPGHCVIDVGANVGQMTLEAALLAGESGRVIAIEPAPGNVELLSAHVLANGFEDRVDVVTAACGAVSSGHATLQVYGNDAHCVGSGHTIRSHGIEPDAQVVEVVVPLVSIDGLCASRSLRPAVIKIDVEGAEVDVFRGARETLQAHRPFVRFGFHPFAFADPRSATDEIRAILADCAYQAPTPDCDGSYALGEFEAHPRHVNRADL